MAISAASTPDAALLLPLLDGMPAVAGPGQAVNAEAFDAWYAAAKPLLVEAKRLDIGEQIFGKTLSHGPADKDGLWPDQVVRSFIEKVASEQVETGLRIECFNKPALAGQPAGRNGLR